MNPAKKTLIFPLLLILLGTGWLLTNLGLAPQIDWVWTLCLAGVGVLMFVIGAFDKVSFVVGGFFVIASVLSLLRQTGRISVDIEIPLLTILLGLLLLAARSAAIPPPAWLKDAPPAD